MTPEVSRLANGLTIISLSMPEVETAAVALNADVGSRHEADHENGLAHLFEHMVFKGTETRSARAIAEEIEDVGGMLNAWTSRDQTVFHARMLGDDLPLAVSLISDLVVSPRFDGDDLLREREVVLSEIGEAADTPDDIVFDHLQLAAYPDQPLGRPILGTAESLDMLDVPFLKDWRDRLYRGEAMVLSAAGKVDHDALVRQAESLLGGLPKERALPPVGARWQGGTLPDGRKAEQTHMTLGHEGPAIHAPGYYAAQIFAMALGGGMSSRLFQEVREERGLAYSVSASHVAYADSGLFSIYLATRPAEASRALDLSREIAVQTAETLTPAEMERGRAQLKAGVLMALEGAGGQADWLGRMMLVYGRPIPAAEIVARLDAVSLEDVRAAGRALLATAPALAVVGPGADKVAR